MKSVQLLLALHNHQPVGNFENVFREAFEKCYEPFLKFLEEHPPFRVSLHYSGCLFDWFEAREKRFLKRLERLIRQNQVEILGGGYYEPLLPLLPERDALRQLQFMNQYLQRRFTRTPSGFWLTERVWEQKIPRLAAQAGLRYTALDDTHFALAGLAESEIGNFFITEEENFPLFLFPIPKPLRYLIPFREPGETIEYLRPLSETESLSIVTYADDGEKFGLWPGTYQWVYRDGWLERFAQALAENQSWISLKTFSEILDEQKGRPVKKVYPASASYEEMTEWSLSRKKGREFLQLKREFESSAVWDRAQHFFQGGTFKNFLVKYPEADWMRSRMAWVSRQIGGRKGSKGKNQAERELWQGQCNCPYWHGVFGGLYLHHLRRSTYEHLIRAERLNEGSKSNSSPHLIETDLNSDGVPELILKSDLYTFFFLPHRGGSLVELDFHPEAMNVLDILTRREEVYHRELVARKESGGGKGRSIHEIEKTVSADVLERMAFDTHDRLSFLEIFIRPGTSFEDFWKGRAPGLTEDPTRILCSKIWKNNKTEGVLTFKGQASLGDLKGKIGMEKRIKVLAGENRLEVVWRFLNQSEKKIDCLVGSSWNFNFYDHERKEEGAHLVEIQDGWSPVHLEIAGKEPFDFWQFPIETIAQTEKDYRLMHQGISIFPHWGLRLAPRETLERSLTFRFSSRR